MIFCHLIFIEQYFYFSASSTQNIDIRNIIDLFYFIGQFLPYLF